MVPKDTSQIKSKYFDFTELSKSRGHIACEYKGWNGLSVTKFDIPKGKRLSNSFINSHYHDLYDKEKIFVITKGSLGLRTEGYQISLGKYDAVDFVSGSQKYQMSSSEDSTVFMISAKDLKTFTGKPVFFNFKKDIEAKDLWGGQCISRPYEGRGLTLVLFDLKPGFKFEDKGHTNEQITWLTEGKMDFYSNGKNKTITVDVGVDIGPNHIHGGVSSGAIGFDAFFPKRNEEKYKIFK